MQRSSHSPGNLRKDPTNRNPLRHTEGEGSVPTVGPQHPWLKRALSLYLKYKPFFAAGERSDFINPLCLLLLGVLGVLFIHSAQSYTGGTQWIMQLIWLGIGGAIYAFLSRVHYKFFLQNAHILYLGTTLALIPLAIEAVFNLPLPLVQTRFGSTRWLDFGVFSLQPAETAKVGTLLVLASILARSQLGSVKDSLTVLGKMAAAFCIPFLLIFLQPDLGSCLVFLPMAFALLYISNLSAKFFGSVIAICALILGTVALDIARYNTFLNEEGLTATQAQRANAYGKAHSWLPLKDYQRNRILSFVAPDVVDPQGIGPSWNRNQSLIAVSGGGLLGKGWGQGTQAKLGYLPRSVASNDFILSVLLEEAGFVGGAFVILLYTALIGNTLRIAGMARDRFGRYMCTGIATLFAAHALVNIGMTLGLMPITGLPLPMVSYGGSFVLVCCVLMGFVQSIYRFRRDFS